MLKWFRDLFKKEEIKWHSGKCDKCDEQFIVWLDSRGLYCWNHYIEYCKDLHKYDDK